LHLHKEEVTAQSRAGLRTDLPDFQQLHGDHRV